MRSRGGFWPFFTIFWLKMLVKKVKIASKKRVFRLFPVDCGTIGLLKFMWWSMVAKMKKRPNILIFPYDIKLLISSRKVF